MMKILINIALAFVLFATSVSAQEKDTLSAFIDKNPNAVEIEVIYEGTRINLSADEEFLLINLSAAHPALQMRFLMQKLTLYVDPSGKKKRNYQISLPYALDVKNEIEAVIAVEGTERGEDERPDIRPLISALNKRGADFLYNGKVLHLGFQHFHVEVDQKNDLLNFYILIPKAELMKDRKLSNNWAIGIFSINDLANMPSPEQGEGGMMPPPMEGEDQQGIQELMQSDIRAWAKFSIDEVNNANLE